MLRSMNICAGYWIELHLGKEKIIEMVSNMKDFKVLMVLAWMIVCPLICNAYYTGMQEISFIIPNSSRALVAEIYYPTQENSKEKSAEHGTWIMKNFEENASLAPNNALHPLVVFSHGFQGDRFSSSWLAEKLVAQGYIVAMIDHTHNTNYEHDALFLYTNMWQRPKDISELLTFLLKHPRWETVLDKNRIAVAGFSLGGFTALWLGGIQANEQNFKMEMDAKYSRMADWPKSYQEKALKVDWKQATQSYYDDRIKAVVAIAPDLGQVFNDTGLGKMKLPTLLIVGDSDQITSEKDNASFYAKHIPNAQLITMKDVEHFSFLNQCSVLGQKILPQLCKDSFKREEIHNYASENIVHFLSDVWNQAH